MKNIGLFGGSFNPVHIAHLVLAERAREQADLDRVIFIPARRPPHKPNRPLASSEDRLAMLNRAIADNEYFGISEVELNRDGPSYTLRTVRAFRNTMDIDGELHLILGGDSVLDLPMWWNAEQLVEEVNIIGVERPDHLFGDLSSVGQALGEDVAASIRHNQVGMPLMNISATDIRERAARGQSIRYLVPESVREYIYRNGLYMGDTGFTTD